jgi:hypothetical protein
MSQDEEFLSHAFQLTSTTLDEDDDNSSESDYDPGNENPIHTADGNTSPAQTVDDDGNVKSAIIVQFTAKKKSEFVPVGVYEYKHDDSYYMIHVPVATTKTIDTEKTGTEKDGSIFIFTKKLEDGKTYKVVSTNTEIGLVREYLKEKSGLKKLGIEFMGKYFKGEEDDKFYKNLDGKQASTATILQVETNLELHKAKKLQKKDAKKKPITKPSDTQKDSTPESAAKQPTPLSLAPIPTTTTTTTPKHTSDKNDTRPAKRPRIKLNITWEIETDTVDGSFDKLVEFAQSAGLNIKDPPQSD